MKIGLALSELHDAEVELVRTLLRTAEHHRSAHDVHHLALDLAAWSRRHLRELAAVGGRYGVDLVQDQEPAHGRHAQDGEPDAGLLLLRDLREVHVRASEVSLDWELLAQAAQATGDEGLLDLVRQCHPDTLRQLRWANAHLKDNTPQVLGD
ncbi:hypothetical protein ACIHCM_26845 [Streptomyces sp. NPDC052023]|uniref:hypothetical protein n=1 Tax=Streptomyces sp. NPDC052023 TaxID=3365681 RepID=UPI0037CD0F09